MKLLITGFAPMGEWKRNASEIVLRSLQEELPPELSLEEHEIIFQIIPASAKTLPKHLEENIISEAPERCLFLGQACKREEVTIERIAINILQLDYPDAEGVVGTSEKIVPGAAEAFFTSLGEQNLNGHSSPNSDPLLQELASKKVPANYSNFGGTSLCNQLLYLALLRANAGELTTACNFVHLPVLPEQCLDEWPDACSLDLVSQRKAVTSIAMHLLSS